MLGGNCSACCVDLDSVAGEHAGVFGKVHRLGGVLTHSPAILYWASTANPYSGVTSFAIATSTGAVILNESQGRWTTEIGERCLGAPEVMAVDWLSPNVVIKGCKDGGVRLWDIRSHGESRESRIQHASQINHARRIDEITIVVAGLSSYVLRICAFHLISRPLAK